MSVCIWVLLFGLAQFAHAEALFFHLDCKAAEGTSATVFLNENEVCLKLDKKGFPVFLEKTPFLKLNKKNIEAAKELKSANGDEIIRLKIRDLEAKKLGEVTQKNIGKPIYLVFDNKIVMNPVVMSAISKEFDIAMIAAKSFINELWFQQLLNPNETNDILMSLIKKVFLLTLGFLLFGFLFMTIIVKRPKQETKNGT